MGAPNCSAIYTMQSFMIGRPGEWAVQEEEELLTLVEDRRIFPPEGWIYRSRVLEENLVITGVDGVTAVLSDDLRNSYSEHDFPIDTSICPPPESSGKHSSGKKKKKKGGKRKQKEARDNKGRKF